MVEVREYPMIRPIMREKWDIFVAEREKIERVRKPVFMYFIFKATLFVL